MTARFEKFIGIGAIFIAAAAVDANLLVSTVGHAGTGTRDTDFQRCFVVRICGLELGCCQRSALPWRF